MKRLITLLLAVVGLFSSAVATADDQNGGNREINFRERTSTEDMNPTKGPRKPAYIPVFGYICDGILTVWGTQEGNAEIDVTDSTGFVCQSESFVLTEGISLPLHSASDDAVTIVVSCNGRTYVAWFETE